VTRHVNQRPGWPPRRALVGVWIATAVVFGLLMAATSTRGALDDPDPARQRPGFLDSDHLPVAAPVVSNAIPSPGRRAVVFFVRPQQITGLCQAISDSGLETGASLAVIVSSPSTCTPETQVVIDDGALAGRFGMPTPVDRGPPVGYAIIDGAGQIRYRTIDPNMAGRLDEVATLLDAIG